METLMIAPPPRPGGTSAGAAGECQRSAAGIRYLPEQWAGGRDGGAFPGPQTSGKDLRHSQGGAGEHRCSL